MQTTATTKNNSLISKAKTWFNSSLFNLDRAGDYFEYLVDGIDPMWSTNQCKARVLGVKAETKDTKTWILQPTERWEGFTPGQHVHFTFTVDGVLHTRTFTLSSSPVQWQQDGTFTLTVKKVKDGRITPWMHESLLDGDIVVISQAQGEFCLPERLPQSVGYIAAGSGITPIMSQLRWLAGRGMPVTADLLYFANTAEDFIFGAEITELEQNHNSLSVHKVASYDSGDEPVSALPQGPIVAEHIQAVLANNPEMVYLCGPYPFREIAKSLLAEAGYDLAKVKEEAFGLPPVKVDLDGDNPVTVSFSGSGVEASTSKPGTLLDMAEAEGLKPTAGCRMGICYTCKCKKKSGQVKNVLTGEISSNDEEEIQICITTPVSDVDLDI